MGYHAIVGSRGYSRLDIVEQYVMQLPLGTTVISGGAAGVDRLAVEVAQSRRLPFRVIRPQYDLWPPKLAPLIRNAEIADAVDELTAFWDGSRGTWNAIACAWHLGKPLRVFDAGGNELDDEEIQRAVELYDGPRSWEMI